MALVLPASGSLLSALDHARLHRVLAVDAAAPEQSLSIDASGVLTLTQNSDTIALSHDGTDAYLKMSDGALYLMTDEGTNTPTTVYIKGKGNEYAQLVIQDGDGQYSYLRQTNGIFSLDGNASVTAFRINEGANDVDTVVETKNSATALVINSDATAANEYVETTLPYFYVSRYSDTYSPNVSMRRSAHNTVGSHTATSVGLYLGSLIAYGDSGSGFTYGGSLDFIQSGAASTYSPTDAVFKLSNGTANTERMRLNLRGNMLLGGVTEYDTTIAAGSGGLEQNASNYYVGHSLNCWDDADAVHGYVRFAKSGSDTVGTHVVVATGETLGAIYFSGSNGAGFQPAAGIMGYADGTCGVDDMPGRLVFLTSPDGSATLVERMRISSAGKITHSLSTAGSNLITFESSAPYPSGLGSSTAPFSIQNTYDNDGSLNFYVSGDAAGATIAFAGTPTFVAGEVTNLTEQYPSAHARGAIALESASGDFKIHQVTITAGTYHIPFHVTATGSEAVFNESSIDMDFRVESNGNANMLFVDAGNDRVGIGTNAPEGLFHIRVGDGGSAATGNDQLVCESNTSFNINIITPAGDNHGALLFSDTTRAVGYIDYYHGDDSLSFYTAGTMGIKIDGSNILNTKNIYPFADDTYYLGKNDDDTPAAWKGVILKDTTNGKYYRVEVINGTVTATDLTD